LELSGRAKQFHRRTRHSAQDSSDVLGMGSGGVDLPVTTTDEVLYIGFNQDQSCFAVGTTTGFKVFNCSPFKETISRVLDGGGIRFVEMLFRCNIFALVGARDNTRFHPNKVIIWDDQRRKDIGELSFRHEVKAVRLRRDKVVVVLEFKVLLYKFADLTCVMELDTVSNSKGLCAVCPSPNLTVLGERLITHTSRGKRPHFA